MRQFRLTAELVPYSCKYISMRQLMTKEDWDSVRKRTYADAGGVCSICSASGRLYCHEIWVYNDEMLVQTLAGFEALCNMCHHVKHINSIQRMAAKGQLDYDDVRAHFCKVNRCQPSAFDAHVDVVLTQRDQRSRVRWTTDLGIWRSLLIVAEQPRLEISTVKFNGLFPGSALNPAARPKEKIRSVVRKQTNLDRDIEI